MGRRELFRMAIWDMVCLGAFVMLPVIRVTWVFLIQPLVAGLIYLCAKGGNPTDVDDFDIGSIPYIKVNEQESFDEMVIFGFSMVAALFWLLTNICLIFATKDEGETSRVKKQALLSCWLWIMLVLILMCVIARWNCLVSDHSSKKSNWNLDSLPSLCFWTILLYRLLVILSVCGYKIQLIQIPAIIESKKMTVLKV